MSLAIAGRQLIYIGRWVNIYGTDVKLKSNCGKQKDITRFEFIDYSININRFKYKATIIFIEHCYLYNNN